MKSTVQLGLLSQTGRGLTTFSGDLLLGLSVVFVFKGL